MVVNHDLSPALSELFLDYDSNVRPPAAMASSSSSIVGGGEKLFTDANGPTKVGTSLHVQEIWLENDQIVLVVVLTQKWRDDRLEFKSPDQLKAKYAVLADKIWTPDTFPLDAAQYSILHDGYYQITGNGTVRLSKIWKIFLQKSEGEFNISNNLESINVSDSRIGQQSNGSKTENSSHQNANFSTEFLNSSIEITKDENGGTNIDHAMINLVSFIYDFGEVEFSCQATGFDNCFTMNPNIRNKFRYFECSTFSNYRIGDRIHSSFRCTFDLV
uniref:Neurotransmitter-gated ion-channel ligand-binding domain-containing protein n=1 Tax=Romanomermis culicivorax TaxID=13658 RepID=A0A915I111_ROMCU